jgi:hypothetical protein
MAGDWIKMTVQLDTDPSVIQIAAAVGLDELGVVGRLWKVWSWADQHSVDGNAVRVTCSFLDRITNCPGFAKAMRDAGWLEGRDSALTFPHFDRHNGHPAKKRALTKDRVNEHRNARSVTPALPEKRRVEKKKSPPTPQGVEGVAEAIFDLYPRKEGPRGKAIESIVRALTKTSADTLRDAVIRFAKKPGLDRENGKFIPLPATWFDDERWKNHLPKPAAPVVHVPRPSKALDDLRWIFGRSPTMTAEESALAVGFISQLTEEDQSFLTPTEKTRIENMKTATP